MPTYSLSGRVVSAKEQRPQGGLRVEAWDKDLLIDDLLGSAMTNSSGAFVMEFDQRYFQELIFDRKPDVYFKVFRDATLIKSTEDSVLWNIKSGKTEIVIEVELPAIDSDRATFQVEGTVTSPDRAGVGRLRVEIVDKNVGGDVLLAETATDERGRYQSRFLAPSLRERGKMQPDLQARVYADKTFLAGSEVRYNATNQETLPVNLPANSMALPSEYETLTGALSEHFKGNLRDLKESDDQQDITYLANKTGWDARAVALAALADQFSQRSGEEIPPVFFYALFRSGLPTNEDTLYHVDAKTLEGVWKKAAEQGVIPNDRVKEIPALIERFRSLSAQKLLSGPALVGTSSLKDMLTASRLDVAQQQRFAELYATHRTDIPTFWDEATKAFGAETAKRLQLDGKLGFLTINNAPLMQELHKVSGDNILTDPLQLAQQGYHRKEKWEALLNQNISIPKEIPGDTPEAKRANYADYLAAQVRLSYPTAAVAEMVKSGDLPLTGAAQSVSGQVHAFLTEHQGKFEIGVRPIQQYIADNKLQVADEIVQQVKRLQRVYQITPSDQALTGLMKRGIDAAYHVAGYDRNTFVQSFATDLGGTDQAALTYDRSVQIHNAVLNIALSYLNARTAPAIGVHSPTGILDPTPANPGDVIAFATLESLFGSMDFCACDHCRSILSPAAYLVDLLQFLDRSNPPAGENPQTVLLERRPDIQHLPLTCENTNTALPYIDVVNETLEYYIANGLTLEKNTLDEYVGHDTSGVASEDLLANPQFVVHSAYTTLRNERFPAPLPFHQPLENLRRYFNKFEVPLPLAMERLRKTDDLERRANRYGWRDILMEEIGLSRAEYEILTDSPTAIQLWRMYGFPKDTKDDDVVVGLSNAKQFCRRIGISYEDLVSILRTRFINPNSDLIPKLQRLGVTFNDLKTLKDAPDNTGDAAFDDLLSKGVGAPDPGEYGGDIKAWVKNKDNYDRIMSLITLTIPAATWKASTVYHLGDCVLPTTPPAGSTLYYECTTAGTSDAKEPTEPTKWPTTPGDSVTNGTTLVWTCRDASSCQSFDNLAFRYSDPAKSAQNIGAVEFVRLLRFVRLWKELGWTIAQTDAAICALYRADLAPLDASDIDDVTKVNTGFLTLLPRLGIVSRVMKELNLTVNRDLLSLLACWSDIGIHDGVAWVSDSEGGRQQQVIPSLYRQMFLNPALLKQDAVFADNGCGEFLQYAEVSYSHTQPTLEQPIVTAASGKLSYNDSIKRLSYSGIIDAATRRGLKAVRGVSQQFKDAIDFLYKAQRLVTHSEALRSAFNLAGNEYDQIADTLGYDASTPLTISNISAIFRRGWLARTLKLSVRELLLLIQLTGLDPFAAPDPTNPAIVRLISLVQALKDRSLKSAAALYLIWNQDLSSKSAPEPAQIAELARTLRGDFASIDDQFAAIEDPNGDVARARTALVYGQETNDAFFALLDDTLVVDVTHTHTGSALEPGIIAADPAIAYDDFRRRLSHRGLMTAPMQDVLKNVSLNGVRVSQDFQDAVGALYGQSEDTKGSFFARNPELHQPYNAVVSLDGTPMPMVDYVKIADALAETTADDSRITYDDTNHRLLLNVDYADSSPTLEAAITSADKRIGYDDATHKLSYSGLLTAARRDVLKNIPDVPLDFQSAVDVLFTLSQKSRGAVILTLLDPELARRRKRQQALQRVSASAGIDVVFSQTMLDPASEPYPLHAAEDQSKPALEDILGVETAGLAAQFFFRDTTTGNVDQSVPAAAGVDYASGTSNPLPNPGNAISGIWSGQIEAPEAGFYNFIIEADGEATVTLTLDGQVRAVTQNGNIRRNTDPIELKAGTLYDIELKVEKVKDALSLKWETPKRPREVIPSRYLYSPTVVGPFSSAYIRFLKAASLANGLGLTANELAYFATYPDYRINALGRINSNGDGWLNALPNADNLHLVDPAGAAVAKDLNAALLTPLRALLDFVRVKADISPSDESLLNVLKDPTKATQDSQGSLFTITRWNQTALNDVLAQFQKYVEELGGTNLIKGLAHFDLFRRVYDAFALIQKMGISAKALIDATTNEPDSGTVRDLQAALRARYDAASWRDVVRPINDEMRSLQRDALVAYILHQMRSHRESAHIDTPDKLFEYFLMDVQMDPSMQTSRIRHALSSVQLFIERCLMNLEPRVSAAAIKPTQWEWMKRYRVWEANRKVYLYPENWLEPELRDDQSPFFKETMSELLQSDITEERAATALLNYLSKLEEVAKLEPCGIYYIPADQASRTVAHVVARTAGAHRKYFYRRYEDGHWTPWEQIKLDIEDNPVIPVVWNHRLFLFWLRILTRGPDTAARPPSGRNVTGLSTDDLPGDSQLTSQAVLSWSEYYNGKWQTTKTSDVTNPVSLGSFAPPLAFDRSTLRLRSDETQDGQLSITIYGDVTNQAFLLYNTHSLPLPGTAAPVRRPYGRIRGFDSAGPEFKVDYDMPNNPFSRDLFTEQTRTTTVQPDHYLSDPWEAPFFYEDLQNVFYVTSEEQPVLVPDDYGTFGMPVNPWVRKVTRIPLLVLQHVAPVSKKFWGDGGPIGPGPGVIDPAPMQWFVTEDAYIRQGLGTTAPVTYGRKHIGPSGAITNLQAET